jgi:hypothetical protein
VGGRALEVTAGAGGYGVAFRIADEGFSAPFPVVIGVEQDGVRRELSAAYTSAGGLTGTAVVEPVPGVRLSVTDIWALTDYGVGLTRSVRVSGSRPASFGTAVAVRTTRAGGWRDVEPFAPGVAYGNGEPVAALSLAGVAARRSGVGTVLIREDRLTAPAFALRYPDGGWIGVLDPAPDGTTIAADGLIEDGDDSLCDDRMRFLSLGGRLVRPDRIELLACYPGTEGEHTYSSGGLPLKQLQAWRRRSHPTRDGFVQRYQVGFAAGAAGTFPAFRDEVWRLAWSLLAPAVAAADMTAVVDRSADVLASQVVERHGIRGVRLESDAVVSERRGEDNSAVMGFVGANTDAAYALLRVGDSRSADPGWGARARRYRGLGEGILDSFVRLPMSPPAGEGYDMDTGEVTTYRRYRGRPAVYARALAEGGLAAVQAYDWELRRHAAERPRWLNWAAGIGHWLVSQQEPGGEIARAWEAGSGAVLDVSATAAYTVVPFLLALHRFRPADGYQAAALRAAEYSWSNGGERGTFAGATLDNPDVIDKEAAILSAEAYLAVLDSTGERRWLDRAIGAARAAETWIYIWNVPMPADADERLLHWKRGVPTVGHQLIATGVSMTDGYLAANAAVFARLFQETDDPHWLDLARMVVHGTTTMLGLDGRVYDLRGPGWQQEHWSFSPRRGFGLNRRWLPWVPVAHIRGVHRIEDLGADIARLVLTGDERWGALATSRSTRSPG